MTEPPELNADESYRLPVKQRVVIEDYVAELAASFVDLAHAVLAPGGSISDPDFAAGCWLKSVS